MAVLRPKRSYNFKHGRYKSKEYRSWQHAKDRCLNKNCEKYPLYGGRGITMHPAWIKSFSDFFKSLGRCPPGHTLDRIDNKKGYIPGNCRWATQKQQQNNRSNNTVLEFNGRRQTLSQWAEEIGISQSALCLRISKGMPKHKIFGPRLIDWTRHGKL